MIRKLNVYRYGWLLLALAVCVLNLANGRTRAADDGSPPQFTVCPTSQTVPTAPGQCGASVAFTVEAIGSPAPVVTCRVGQTVITSPHTFPLGATEVICSAANGVGRIPATCSFTITVTDNQPPVLVCPPSQTVPLASPAGTVVTFPLPAATDNCGLEGGVVCNPPSGSTFPLGTTAVTCSASDVLGQTGTCSFNVNVVCPAITLSALPNGAQGVAYSQSITAAPAGVYSFAVSGGQLPPGLALAANGTLSGTPSAGGTFNFNVTATEASGCTGTRAYTLTITGACQTITVNPASLPAGTLGAAYNQTITATGGVAPFSFAVTQGALPNGLTLTAAGALSGTPTVGGSFSFRLTATDANGCTGLRLYVLTIGCGAGVTINPATLPNATAGFPYSQQLTASPAGTYTFSLFLGQFPPGFTMNSAGLISGFSSVAGTFNFTIRVMSGNCVSTRAYTLIVDCPAITLAALPDGALGTAYSQTLTAAPATGTYTFALHAGALPNGLTLNGATGVLSGTPTAAGVFNFTLRANGFAICQGTRAYTLTISGGAAALAQRTAGDFDGDGKTDLAVWRGAQSAWLILNSSNQAMHTAQWGSSNAPYHDVLAAGDYDGDGKTDVAVFRRQNATWYIKGSANGAVIEQAWGAGTDTPVAADYDGDGQTDIAVWRGATGQWLIRRSSDNTTQTVTWGAAYAPYHDLPVAADYDGDGKCDVAVFRRQTGTWFIRRSSDGQVVTRAWGLGTDVPVAADYDGDGQADIAVWRGSDTNWYILNSGRSSDGQVVTRSWGTAALGDVPVPGDYDGDGKADLAVWRPGDGVWYVIGSANGSFTSQAHGQAGDTPVRR